MQACTRTVCPRLIHQCGLNPPQKYCSLYGSSPIEYVSFLFRKGNKPQNQFYIPFHCRFMERFVPDLCWVTPWGYRALCDLQFQSFYFLLINSLFLMRGVFKIGKGTFNIYGKITIDYFFLKRWWHNSTQTRINLRNLNKQQNWFETSLHKYLSVTEFFFTSCLLSF